MCTEFMDFFLVSGFSIGDIFIGVFEVQNMHYLCQFTKNSLYHVIEHDSKCMYTNFDGFLFFIQFYLYSRILLGLGPDIDF